MIKRILVCGAGGFIGSHLVNKLVEEGFYVRGVDLKEPEWSKSKAQEFVLADLREPDQAANALSGGFDHVYQLAADMGGMGFIHSAETEIMRNSMLVNLNVIEQAARTGVKKYFLASSVCVYRDMKIGEGELSETDAYPANPDNEYGWEKLYAERAVLAYGREFGLATRIARFQNCYGPEGTWVGGREKAPAALCRKVAESTNGQIEAWGDGTAVRSFIYVDDLVAGIRKLMESDIQEPTNIGTREYVSVQELVQIVANVANKQIKPQWINGPVGVQSRNFSNDLIESTGFKPIYSLAAGLALTYPWIEEQLLAFNS
jgi:GDP-D-mannose 3',5'-epimerase|tara:strand:- start:755 stop:1705 length:951 start_codon:yes stop_codon:yes gene_type:complete